MDLLNILFSIVLLFVIMYFILKRKISTACIHGSPSCKDENGISIDATCNKDTRTWECTSGTSNVPFTPQNGCECSDDINITCPAGKTLQVNTAFYGRKDPALCPGCQGDTTACSLANALDPLRAAAKKGAITMNKNAYNTFYGTNMCPSVSKYTTFRTRCI